MNSSRGNGFEILTKPKNIELAAKIKLYFFRSCTIPSAVPVPVPFTFRSLSVPLSHDRCVTYNASNRIMVFNPKLKKNQHRALCCGYLRFVLYYVLEIHLK